MNIQSPYQKTAIDAGHRAIYLDIDFLLLRIPPRMGKTTLAQRFCKMGIDSGMQSVQVIMDVVSNPHIASAYRSNLDPAIRSRVEISSIKGPCKRRNAPLTIVDDPFWTPPERSSIPDSSQLLQFLKEVTGTVIYLATPSGNRATELEALSDAVERGKVCASHRFSAGTEGLYKPEDVERFEELKQNLSPERYRRLYELRT